MASPPHAEWYGMYTAVYKFKIWPEGKIAQDGTYIWSWGEIPKGAGIFLWAFHIGGIEGLNRVYGQIMQSERMEEILRGEFTESAVRAHLKNKAVGTLQLQVYFEDDADERLKIFEDVRQGILRDSRFVKQ